MLGNIFMVLPEFWKLEWVKIKYFRTLRQTKVFDFIELIQVKFRLKIIVEIQNFEIC